MQRVSFNCISVFQSCEICQEQFEQYWDEEEEEWHLKNAIRVDEKVTWKITLVLACHLHHHHRLLLGACKCIIIDISLPLIF